MTDLAHQDALYLRAAEGWLELGLPAEALAEVQQLSTDQQHHPVALAVLWRVYSETGHWRKGVEVADELVQREPTNSVGWVHRSYALHELKRTQEAADLLRPALKLFPREEIIPYNLACYACRLGDSDEAKALLLAAFEIGPRAEIKRRAMSDPDFAEMRSIIAGL